MKLLQYSELAVILFLALACSQKTTKDLHPSVLNSWDTLHGNGYSIQYPKGWDLNIPGTRGTVFDIISRPSNPDEKFRANVNFFIQDLTGLNLDLDKYAHLSEGQIKNVLSNSNLLESKKLNAYGINFQKELYTGDHSGQKLKFEQYYWVINDKAYILTLTCEINQFDTYKKTGEKILNSFKFNQD